MVDKSELLRVPTFQGLPDDQLDWFLSHCQEVKLKPGEFTYARARPTDAMFVVLEGELQVRGEFAGETVVLPFGPGAVTGVLPFSRMKQVRSDRARGH